MNSFPHSPLPPRPDKKGLKKRGPKKAWLRWLGRISLALAILGVAVGIGTGFALFTVYQQLPDVRQLEHYTLPMATEVYTASGQLLTRMSSEGRYDPIAIENVPQHVQDAVISAEDRRFWQHEGVDYLGLARSIYLNVRKRQMASGASTLTQQLIKNLFLTPERTAKRKIAEALLAFQLERKYSKHQILEMYLNLAFLGHNVYGVEAAAQIYFGKSARQLTIAESALLAGIIRGPEYYSPYHRPDDANKLKEIVLQQMAKDGRITDQQLQAALAQKIRLVGLRTAYPHPYFLDYVMYSLRQKYGDTAFRQGGWKVYTTIDPALQTYAERLLKEELPRLKRSGAHQAALVSIESSTGYIRSLVGGVSYAESQFNRAFQGQRQIGSTFKPFVYLTAFEKGMTLQDRIDDAPASFGGYRPRNYDRRFRGEVTLLDALTWSLNVPTVKLANQLGIYNVIQTARQAGNYSPIAADLTSALGSSEMNLLELTGAYATFANDGVLVKPTAITKIVDANGQVVFEYFPPMQRVFKKSATDQLNFALKNVVQSGTGKAARIGRPAAGKTGTTDSAYDTWFVGYVPQLVTGVWVGNDTPSATRGGGGSTCAPIWRKYMQQATQRLAIKDFVMPGYTASTSSAEPSVTPEPSSSNSIVEIPAESATPEATLESRPPAVEPAATQTQRTPPPRFSPPPAQPLNPSPRANASASAVPSAAATPTDNQILEMTLPDLDN